MKIGCQFIATWARGDDAIVWNLCRLTDYSDASSLFSAAPRAQSRPYRTTTWSLRCLNLSLSLSHQVFYLSKCAFLGCALVLRPLLRKDAVVYSFLSTAPSKYKYMLLQDDPVATFSRIHSRLGRRLS